MRCGLGPWEESRNAGLMEGVVAGIAHYGNCVGVPTVAGEVAFDPATAAIRWSMPWPWA